MFGDKQEASWLIGSSVLKPNRHEGFEAEAERAGAGPLSARSASLRIETLDGRMKFKLK